MAKLCTRCCCALCVVLLAILAKLVHFLVIPGLFIEEETAPTDLDKCGADPDDEDLRFEVDDDEREAGKLKPEKLGAILKSVDQFGFAVIDHVLAEDLVEELRDDILHHVELGNASNRPRAGIAQAGLRHHHMFQPWTDQIVTKVLTTLGVMCQASTGATSGIFSDIIPCGATMVEMGAITVESGAEAQDIHPDAARRSGDSRMISAFFTLQETNADNGALMLIPGSHRCAESQITAQPEMLPGSVVLMDSTLRHGGGAHVAGLDRVVWYFTFAEDSSKSLPGGATYALRPELWGQLSLPLRSATSSCSTCSSSKTYSIMDILHYGALVCDEYYMNLDAFVSEAFSEEDLYKDFYGCLKNASFRPACFDRDKFELWRRTHFKSWLNCKRDQLNVLKVWGDYKMKDILGHT
eukprot:TRINITY_DN5882_c1_g1_i4.p1 TRINITY_DN5882_c1_g1~~TRINITY_DN5882_c1_g1_i4.p1  ORF type:complete len:410 (-),score=56.25 TRINITY_DN5882_c1_g1_i4:344-1573(-)